MFIIKAGYAWCRIWGARLLSKFQWFKSLESKNITCWVLALAGYVMICYVYIYTNILNPLDHWNKPREFLGSLMLWYVHQFQGIPMAIACWIVGNPTIPPISSEPVTQDFTFLEVKWLASWWLNQPQLKNMSQNGFIFPKVRGENSKKYLKPPPILGGKSQHSWRVD